MKEQNNFHHVKESTLEKRAHKADYGKEKIRILYKDRDIVVIEKPSGMLCVPYPGSKARTVLSVLTSLLSHEKGSPVPLVVHRLDRDTSGVMMFALNEVAQKRIMDTWHTMVTERIYRAVAENPRKNPLADAGLIDAPLAFNSHTMGYVPSLDDKSAKTVPARTHFRVIERGKTHTLFELSLDTGKKNQIRAHLSSRGYPLAGDENYRAKTDPFHRLALHARTLCFVHPFTKEEMRFEIPEPEEWLLTVKNGAKNEVPSWRKQGKNEKKHDIIQGERKLTKKQISKMDFIEQMKYLHGK